MSEANMRSYFRLRTRTILHIESFSDRMSKGMPDTAYLFPTGEMGWLEFKYLPKLFSASVIPWTNKEQPLWLNRWARKGGRSGVILRIAENDCWLYWRASPDIRWVTWSQTSAVFDTVTWRCFDGLDLERLLSALRA